MPIKKDGGMRITKPTPRYYDQASERLIYRVLVLDDVVSWTPFFNDDDYQRFLGQDLTVPGTERSKVWIERQIQRKAENCFGQLAIIKKQQEI